jgi:D-sedoheptulose 7-phosphate isomerase
MQRRIIEILQESLAVKDRSIRKNLENLEAAARCLADRLTAGNKILLFGNGGSAADAQHIAAELVNRLDIERAPLAAMALTTDTSVITAIGNDTDFEIVFARQIEALGKPGDVAWAISTSGRAPNVLAGIKSARRINLYTIGMSGEGGRLIDEVDLPLTAASKSTPRVQETFLAMAHIICVLVEQLLFPEKG